MISHLRYQEGELFVVQFFDVIRRVHECVELLVKWKGFSDEESDWVALASWQEHVPILLAGSLADFRRNGTTRPSQVASTQ